MTKTNVNCSAFWSLKSFFLLPFQDEKRKFFFLSSEKRSDEARGKNANVRMYIHVQEKSKQRKERTREKKE